MGLITGAIKLIVGIVAIVVFIALISGAFFVYRHRMKSNQVDEIEYGGLPPTLTHAPQPGIQKPQPMHGAVPAGDPYGQYFQNGKP
ncbi:hypothetical protein J7T55_001668 [Diaporthe amygdali]|uniref:uncharacterized protein n=1 Tax=Phomopsis amygdali TaxID=1214568 RepID=UPI0022FE3153|nr:uncharacterized protein J7T55_001668 [Diaporthe amygdali]KAJ0115258.1 hypothetical protein J7T55_001668 [Diaporthe amygdali]